MSATGTKECPFCAETIKAAAVLCRFCGRELTRTDAALETASAPGSNPPTEPLIAPSRIEKPEIFDTLTTLVEKSLVIYEEDEQGRGRYRLLETVRQYARDRLSEAGEGKELRDRHLACFAALAEQAEPELWRQVAWLDRLESEHDNLRAGLEWGAGSNPEAGVRLAGMLWWYWWIRGHWTEARQRLETALAESANCGPAHRWKALCAAGFVATDLWHLEQAWSLAKESLALCRQSGDKAGEAWSLMVLARVPFRQRDSAQAVPFRQVDTAQTMAWAEDGLALFREIGDKPGTAVALLTLASALGDRDAVRATALEEECRALCRQEGYRWLSAVLLIRPGSMAFGNANDPERAKALLEESLAVHREIGNPGAASGSLLNLATVVASTGDLVRATALLEESLAAARECGGQAQIGQALVHLGRLAVAQGDHERARVLFEEALILARELGVSWIIAGALLGLARVALAQGDMSRKREPSRAPRAGAQPLLEEARALVRGSDRCMAMGHELLEMGEYAAARSCYEEGLALRRAGSDSRLIAAALLEAGHAAWLLEEPGVAQSHAREALELFREQKYENGMIIALQSLGAAALGLGQHERAARLFGAVEGLQECLQLRGEAWWRRPGERISQAVRAAALETAFAAVWAECRAMSLDEAIAFALEQEAPS